MPPSHPPPGPSRGPTPSDKRNQISYHSLLHWVLLAVAAVVLLEVILAILGIGGLFAWLITVLYHCFKSDAPPGVEATASEP